MKAFEEYRILTRRVGGWYVALSVLARLPIAMTTFGTITFLTVERGSVADAGLVAAVLAVSTAICQPLHGRWSQRAGQRLPMLLVAPLSAAALVGLVWAGSTGAPLALVVVLAAVVGMTTLPVSGLARVRWGAVVRGEREARAATSLESVLDELTFVMGPALVGVLAAVLDAAAPMLINAAAQLVLIPLFALHPLAPGPAGGDLATEDISMRRALGYVWAPVLAMVMVGTFFGSVQTTVAAVAQHLGEPGAGGLIYALLGLGSAATALTAVALPASISLRARVLAAAAVMALAAGLALPIDRAQGPWAVVALGALMVLAGTGVGVALVSIYALIGDAAPPSTTPVAMTAAGAATIAGVAVGAAVGGQVSESIGAGSGFVVSVLACAALALLVAGRARRAPRDARPHAG